MAILFHIYLTFPVSTTQMYQIDILAEDEALERLSWLKMKLLKGYLALDVFCPVPLVLLIQILNYHFDVTTYSLNK